MTGFFCVMNIIEYNNYEITPTQEAFLIGPIRKLFNADKSKTKEKFMQQMSVIYFYADPRSSYSYIIDDELRLNAIIEQEGLPKTFKITGDLREAIEIYKKHCITSSSLLLQSTKIAIEKLRQFLENVDLTKTDDKGKPMYTVNSITSAIKQIPQLAKDVMTAEKAIAKEIEENSRVRGGNDNLTIMDNGILI